jgi:Rhodopirellula transposase DDE domain
MNPYPSEIEQHMQRFYHSLSEKDRRRYAAIEALKLGYGGISYICCLLGCDYSTVKHGIADVTDPIALEQQTIRQPGGGRKSAFETIEHLDTTFLQVLAEHTAGSPMDETIKWTNLTRQEIVSLMHTAGISISVTVVDQLLEKHHFRRRQAVKTAPTGECDQRDEQFVNIARLKEAYQASGNPVLSMDVKKKSSSGTSTAKGRSTHEKR